MKKRSDPLSDFPWLGSVFQVAFSALMLLVKW